LLRHLWCIFVAVTAAWGQTTAVLTGGYDIGRTNANLNETALTPATVSPTGFGRLFQLPADGQIYAQPFYMANVTVAGQGVHNVVFFATEHNSVYACDADAAAPPLWTVNLGPSVPSSAYGSYSDIAPEIGILGTPVIDPSTGTLYVVAATVENGTYYYRLHALDTASGVEKFGAPVAIAASVEGSGIDSVNGVVTFTALQHIQRPALLLVNGVVYVAFGSHADNSPWHGWIMGYSAANVQNQTAVLNTTPNSWGGAVWHSGRGLSADSQGNIYAVTGNGGTDENTEYSDNVLRLNPGDLTVGDWFAPYNVQTLDDDDDDLGASGAVLIPGTNLLITGGKQGDAYVLNSGSLGHMTDGAQYPQSFQAADGGMYNMAIWNRSTGPVLYLHGGNSPVAAYTFTGSRINIAPSSQISTSYPAPYEGMAISANGGKGGSGILWMVAADVWSFPTTGTLYAFNADDLSSELWNSSMNLGRDALGTFTKFANPTVANGKVYVPTSSAVLAVYGPLGSAAGTPVITGLVNGASYSNGGVAPGEIVNIFGQNLGPQTLVTGSWDSNGTLSSGIGGTQVTFDGIPAPLLYASAFAIAAIVPFEVAGANQNSVQVSYNGSVSPAESFDPAATAPGIFTSDASGSGQADVLNQDYSLNSQENPAAAGSVVMVYATGGGQTTPPDSTGSTEAGPAQVAAAVSATIGGLPAQVSYAGQAPGEVAGVMQVNLQVPNGVSGSLPLVLTVGGVSSQATATIAVR